MMNVTFEFMKTVDGIPSIKITKIDNEYRRGFHQGYMTIFRNYAVQISSTEEGYGSEGNSVPKPADFYDLDRDTLVKHIDECIRYNRKTSYDFGIEYEDIPKDILEAFIEASIEASHNWCDVCRGEYKIKVDKYLRDKINNLPEISMEELERRYE